MPVSLGHSVLSLLVSYPRTSSRYSCEFLGEVEGLVEKLTQGSKEDLTDQPAEDLKGNPAEDLEEEPADEPAEQLAEELEEELAEDPLVVVCVTNDPFFFSIGPVHHL